MYLIYKQLSDDFKRFALLRYKWIFDKELFKLHIHSYIYGFPGFTDFKVIIMFCFNVSDNLLQKLFED